MALSNGSVKGAVFKATVIAQTLAPFVSTLPISVPFDFSDVENLKVITGTFTPANNIHTIVSGLSSKPPTFAILITDKRVVFGETGFNWMVMPVDKFLFMVIPSGLAIDGWAFEGRTSHPAAMEQGAPVNYTLITGYAAIS